MHWITAPGTSHPEERRIVTQASREMRAIPGVRNFGSHIGQAFLAEEVVGVELRRELGQRRPQRRLRQDARRDRGGGRRPPRALPRRADLPARAHRRGAGRRRASRSSCASSARTSTTLRARPSGSRRRSSGIDGLDDLHVELAADVPEIEVSENLAAARALRAQAGRRPPRGGGAGVQRGGRRHLPRRPRLRRARVEHARDAPQPDRRAQPPDRHARRRARAPRRRGHRARPADAERRSTARTRRAGSTSPPTSARPQPQRDRRRRPRPARRRSSSRRATTPS